MTLGLRRWAPLLIASAIAAGPLAVAGPARASSTSPPCIVITFVGAAAPPTKTVCRKRIISNGDGVFPGVTFRTPGDVKNHTPTAQLPNGGGNAPNSWGVASLFADQAIPLTGISLVKIPRTTGGFATLSGADLSSPDFLNGQVPTFTLQTRIIGFDRPLRNGASNDTNNTDIINEPNNAPLNITVYLTGSGSQLHPSIAVAPGSPQAGQSVTLTAAVPDAPVGVTLDYEWDFGDGKGGSGSAPTHIYGEGLWAARVSVSSQDGAYYGQSDSTLVQVGPAPDPTTGASKTGGGDAGAHHPVTGPKKGHGKGPGGGGQQDPPTIGATATTHSDRPASTVTGASTGASGSAARSGGSDGPKASVSASSSGTPAPVIAGNFVDGIVIAGAPAALPSAGASEVESSRSSAAAAASRRPSTPPFDAKLLWWSVLPALLILGALRERRRPAPRSRHA